MEISISSRGRDAVGDCTLLETNRGVLSDEWIADNSNAESLVMTTKMNESRDLSAHIDELVGKIGSDVRVLRGLGVSVRAIATLYFEGLDGTGPIFTPMDFARLKSLEIDFAIKFVSMD